MVLEIDSFLSDIWFPSAGLFSVTLSGFAIGGGEVSSVTAVPGDSSALWTCASSFSRTFLVIVPICLSGKHISRAVWVFIFTIPGGQHLISQAVFLIWGEFPLRTFLFIFGIVASAPRFSENNVHRRGFHIRKILFGFVVVFPLLIV